MSITVYLQLGGTLRFEGCSEAKYINGFLVFSYKSASRNVACQANFGLNQIAGWSRDI